jgi:hypothetical protein
MKSKGRLFSTTTENDSHSLSDEEPEQQWRRDLAAGVMKLPEEVQKTAEKCSALEHKQSTFAPSLLEQNSDARAAPDESGSETRRRSLRRSLPVVVVVY